MQFLLDAFLSIPAILIAFSVKEYTRAKMADKLGDKSPRFKGELTLDPLKHVDIAGALMMAFFGFGWSKSVEINKYAFKNPKKDALKVNIAAWLSNCSCCHNWSNTYKFIFKIFWFKRRSFSNYIFNFTIYNNIKCKLLCI